MWGPEAAGADMSQAGSEQVGAGKGQGLMLGLLSDVPWRPRTPCM